MKHLPLIGCLIGSLLLFGKLAVAHHSFAMFDDAKELVITGMGGSDWQYARVRTRDRRYRRG